MTTKPRASKYRLRPNAPLAPGVDPVAVRRAALGAEGEQAATGTDGSAARDGAGAAAHGEVHSAAEVESETEIARIRREGLTGRQLRMARRVAQKHGLAPTSDFDAVRLLRARGIDPFSRANMLAVVRPRGEAGRDRQTLPSTVAEAPAPAPAAQPGMPGIKVPPESAGEIRRIQRDIARRRRRRTALLFARLAVFVFLPTAIVGWYYAMVATPMYATHSEFVIQQADSPAGGGLGGLFQGTGLAVQQDSTTVQSYLQSRDAMLRLDRDQGFKAHFSQDWIDPIQRLAPDASNEDAYKLYKKYVKLGYDPTEGVIRMELSTADPAASAQFSEKLIDYAEERVDELSSEKRSDAVRTAAQSLEQAKDQRRDAQRQLVELQEGSILDPEGEIANIRSLIGSAELQLQEKQLALNTQLNNARPNQARVEALQGEIEGLESELRKQNARLTEASEGTSSLAAQAAAIQIAQADLATADMVLQSALEAKRQSEIEANKQVRYLTVSVKPVPSQDPSYPRSFENTVLAFLIFAGIYMMISLTASILREQVSS